MPSVAPRGAPFLLFAYFLSGATALGYEILWARWLSLQFGVSNLGVLLAVFSFLLGLGLGSALGLRRHWSPSSAVRWFAGVELGVALYMALLPGLAGSVYGHWSALAGHFTPIQWQALEGVLAVIALTLPAIALGSAFTALVQGWRGSAADLERLYGFNTVGGVLGALLPLFLLPSLGWLGTLWVLVGVGLSAGLLGLWIVFKSPDRESVPGASLPMARSLWLYALVGAGAIMLEIAWARLFGLLFLRTEYVMGVILATYLIGVGLGSLWARRIRRDIWVSVLPLVVALTGLFSLAVIGFLGSWVEAGRWESLTAALAIQAMMLMLIMTPATVAMGLWLPLLAKREGRGSGPALYAVNSVGGALGALLAGLVIVPLWGTAAALVCAAMLLLLAGLALAPRRWSISVALPIAFLAFPLWAMPDPAVLLPRSFAGTKTLFSYEDAVNITHVVEEKSGERLLLSDLQRMDASTEPQAVAGQRNQVRLGLMLHPHPQRVLLLGLGTGISASASLALPDAEVVAVELSRGAIEAVGRFFQKANLGVADDIRVVHDDARHFLLAAEGRFDVVVGDLFHPDLVGRSALLSVQQFQRVRSRLADDGVFVQWLTLNQFDLDSLQVVLRSFARVFPHSYLFLDSFRLALVGSLQPLKPYESLRAHAGRLSESRFAFLTGGEGEWTWLGRYWGGLDHLPAGPVQDEWAPRIEFDLPKARFAGTIDVAANVEWLLSRRPRVETAMRTLAVDEAWSDTFRRAYQASALGLRGFLLALRGDGESDRWLRLAYESNPDDRWVSTAYATRLMDTLGQARSKGLDEASALDRVLSVRPDFIPALRRRHALALQRGESDLARALAARIRALDPYGRWNEGVASGSVPMMVH